MIKYLVSAITIGLAGSQLLEACKREERNSAPATSPERPRLATTDRPQAPIQSPRNTVIFGPPNITRENKLSISRPAIESDPQGSTDGHYTAFGEVEVLTTLLDHLSLNPSASYTQKFNQASQNWYSGNLPAPLTRAEAQSLYRELARALPQYSSQRALSRSILWMMDDLQSALRTRSGVYSFERRYPPSSSFTHQNNSAEMKSLVQRYFPSISNPSEFLNADIIEYADLDQSNNSRLVFIIPDFHDRDHQQAVIRMARLLVDQGVTTLFAESTPYFSNREIRLPMSMRLGSALYTAGSRQEAVLQNWPAPRASEALEFFFGQALATYGSEDPRLYESFAYLADGRDLDAKMNAMDRRSQAMANNIHRQMNQRQSRIALFINGGSHTDEVLAQLRRNNINYVVALPRDGVIHPRMLTDARRYYAPR